MQGQRVFGALANNQWSVAGWATGSQPDAHSALRELQSTPSMVFEFKEHNYIDDAGTAASVGVLKNVESPGKSQKWSDGKLELDRERRILMDLRTVEECTFSW